MSTDRGRCCDRLFAVEDYWCADIKAAKGIFQDVHPEFALGRFQTPRSQPPDEPFSLPIWPVNWREKSSLPNLNSVFAVDSGGGVNLDGVQKPQTFCRDGFISTGMRVLGWSPRVSTL